MLNLVQFTVSPRNDAADVHAILEAHVERERTKSVRQFWVHMLAAVGGLIALCMIFPPVALLQTREVLLALWGACAVCAIIALALECRWYLRESQLLAAHKAADEE